ncbi:MAG TPA: cytochrome c, partial [Thermoanaerobaculia bacterium]|nr:cytochrome c [Thermoanaerobaculia bacterium]
NSPHPYATFGCTSCHAGRDRATDFMRAGHMPNDFEEYERLGEELKEGRDAKGLPIDADALKETIDETQTGRWIKSYGWMPDKFNDLPMYPMKAVEAGCFRCHKNDAEHAKAPHLDQGRKLIENLGCWGCHKMKGFEELPKVGPSLLKVSTKTNPEWVSRWLVNPRTFRHNTRMPRFFYLSNFQSPRDRRMTDTMVAGVVSYLFKDQPNAAAGSATTTSGDSARGKALFQSLGCQGCHISDPAAERHVMDSYRQHGPNLIGLADKTTPEWIAAWLKNPKAYNPETRMPNLRLADDEIADLTAFLLSSKASDAFRATPVPQPDAEERDLLVLDYLTQSKSIVDAKADLGKMSPHDKDLFVGEKIIANYGCYACHDIGGFEKAKPIGVELSEWGNKPVHLLDFGFVKIPDTRADWFAQKVREPRVFDRDKVKNFQEKLKMPLFSFSEDEVRALQSTVLGFQKDDMAEPLKASIAGDRGAIESGRRVVKSYNCRGCHILEEKGGEIRDTLPDVALAPPNIRGEGAKVQSDWLFSFLHAPKSGQIRPWLKVRMPTFEFADEKINSVTRYFASLEKAPYPFVAKVETVEASSRAAGAKVFEAMKCFQCHPTSPEAFQQALAAGKSPADLAPILSAAHSRLRYDWINDWIKRPEEWMPGTRMPTNFPKDDTTGKRTSILGMALDTPAFAPLKKDLTAIWGSEEEAKAFISDPDRVTKALRDHIWSLGNASASAETPAAKPARRTRVAARAPSPPAGTR